jgi:predicted dehydrogenase
VSAMIDVDPGSGVDRSISGMMEFGGGVASFTCSTRLVPFQRVSVFGTRGRLELELPFNPPTDRPHRAMVERDGVAECVQFDICDQYGIQANLFSRAILKNADAPTPIDDALANMRVIESLARSADKKYLPHTAPRSANSATE